MDVYTVPVKLSFRAESAEEARAAAVQMLEQLADDMGAPEPEGSPEWLAFFVADAVESGVEV